MYFSHAKKQEVEQTDLSLVFLLFLKVFKSTSLLLCLTVYAWSSGLSLTVIIRVLMSHSVQELDFSCLCLISGISLTVNKKECLYLEEEDFQLLCPGSRRSNCRSTHVSQFARARLQPFISCLSCLCLVFRCLSAQ
jgi:hypothetical protein